MTRKDGRWSLSARTICSVCGKPIGKRSYSCPGPAFDPAHLRCVYPEMAATTGDDE